VVFIRPAVSDRSILPEGTHGFVIPATNQWPFGDSRQESQAWAYGRVELAAAHSANRVRGQLRGQLHS
jgi:hypothetical protein